MILLVSPCSTGAGRPEGAAIRPAEIVNQLNPHAYPAFGRTVLVRLTLFEMVPVERIELPTFGLQNRCSTAELNRRIEAIGEGESIPPLGPIFGGSKIRLGRTY